MEPDAHLNSPSIVTTQSRERNTDSVTNATNVSAEAPPSQSLANSTTITNTQVSVPVSQGTDGRNLKPEGCHYKAYKHSPYYGYK